MPTSEPLPENADQPENPQPPQDVVRAPAQTHSPVTVLIAQIAAVLAGGAMAVQSRVNGELGARTGDSVAAGLTGFSVGFAIVLLGTVLIPAGRRGLITALGAFRARRLPAIFLLSGVFGAFLVVVQTVTTPMVGVSVFILGMVVGQSVGGLGVDRAGIGPGGMKPLTGWRLLGTGIIVISVLIAQLPHFGDDGAEARSPALILALLLLPVLAGLGSALQTAFNGRIGAEAGTPITPTVLNFAEGVLALIVATVIHRLTADLPPWHFPSEWWLYLGGVCGVLFVAAGAVLSRIIGILRTSLSLTAGMLTGALLLDLLVPTSGAVVAPLTVLGTALTFVGLVVVSLPWKRRASTA
ncbi:DMT family transporter [Kocuria palustris]|uniref:DMT family transporter n=1 Tax=Kocuria palustris TaxID=71999 RepID=UPI0009E9358A|nr:DMT family transporter [Kocuria palustris]